MTTNESTNKSNDGIMKPRPERRYEQEQQQTINLKIKQALFSKLSHKSHKQM